MAVAVTLANLALTVVQEELGLILTGGLSALLLGFLLRTMHGRSPLIAFSHYRPSIFSRCYVDRLLPRHVDTPPSLRSPP